LRSPSGGRTLVGDKITQLVIYVTFPVGFQKGESMFTVEAVIDEDGNVKILQPVPLQGARRALLVILDEPALLVAETALLSEAALAEDWLRPEEDEAWSYLNRATS
jgi:hypothetical protein